MVTVFLWSQDLLGATAGLYNIPAKNSFKKMRDIVGGCLKRQKTSDQWQESEQFLKQAHDADTKSWQHKEHNASYHRAK
jgi:hypothetical protein